MIIHGDALMVLRGMESESVNCVITSPPYWGLRDYGVEGQLGLEKTYQEYLDKLLAIFDAEARRRLAGDQRPAGARHARRQIIGEFGAGRLALPFGVEQRNLEARRIRRAAAE